MDIRPRMRAQARLALACALALSCTAACAAEPEQRLSHSHPHNAANYVDIVSYLSADADIDAWYTLGYQLKDDFDRICGDTFCEGDYSNIQSLSYRCSVEEASGALGHCAWIFAASNEDIDPASGAVVVDARHWSCPSPIAPGTRAEDFLHVLAVKEPLYQPLPGTGQSLYDGLIDCL